MSATLHVRRSGLGATHRRQLRSELISTATAVTLALAGAACTQPTQVAQVDESPIAFAARVARNSVSAVSTA